MTSNRLIVFQLPKTIEYYVRITVWFTPAAVLCFIPIFRNPCHAFAIISINFKGTDVNIFFRGIHITAIISVNCDSLEMEGFQCSYVVPDAECFIFPLTNHLL